MMATKTKYGHRIVFDLDDETYDVLKAIAEDMQLSDNKCAKVMFRQMLGLAKNTAIIFEKLNENFEAECAAEQEVKPIVRSKKKVAEVRKAITETD